MVVVKKGSQFCVMSKDKSRNLGCYDTEEEAKKRLSEVEYFKKKGKELFEEYDSVEIEESHTIEIDEVKEDHDMEEEENMKKKKKKMMEEEEMKKKKMSMHDDMMKKKMSMMKEGIAIKANSERFKTPSGRELRTSKVYGFEWKESGSEMVVEGFIATTHKDSVNDIIAKETLEKWAQEINAGIPRVNKASYHHDRSDPRVVGVAVKDSAQVLPLQDGEHGLYVKTLVNRSHELFPDIQYEWKNNMLDSFSIEYDTYENATCTFADDVRLIGPETELFGYTFASRPINEHAVAIKEVLKKEMKEDVQMVKLETKEEQVVAPVSREAKESIVAVKGEEKKEETFAEEAKEKLVKEILESKEFKKAVEGIKVETKVLLNEAKEGMSAAIEVKEYRDIFQGKEKVSVEEQFKRAGALADKLGLTTRFVKNKEAGTPAESRQYKHFTTNGRRLEFKNLALATNQNTDTDYLLSAAELADVFDPVIYNALNEAVSTWNVLAKDDYSNKGNNQVQFTLKTAANTTAAFYTGNAVTTAQTTRMKYMTRFKKVQVGVAVDGDMVAAARGGPIGDVFAQEVKDATETLMSVANNALYDEVGLETAAAIIGFEYIADNAGNGTLYNVTRSAANRLAPDANGDTYINGGAADVTLANMRAAIRQCTVDGSNRNDLVFFCHPLQGDKIKSLFDDQLRYDKPTMSRFGFETQLYIDGVPVFLDKDANTDDIFCVDVAAHRLGIWVPPTLEMMGKRSDADEGFIKMYLAAYNRAPRRLVLIYNNATA